MTGVIRAPITAIILLFELTNDYNLILPIMLTTAVCLIVVERLAPDGIYHLGLARKGVRLVRGRDIDLMQTVTVGEAMTTDVSTVPATLPVDQLDAAFDVTNTHGLLVTDGDGLMLGILTLQDLARAKEQDFTGKTAGDIATRTVITVTPETPISEALRLIGTRDLGRLPVVDSANPRKILGLLRRRDIVRAYDLATQRKLDSTRTMDHVRLETYSRTHVLELRVESHSEADEHRIREVHWPSGSVIATVRHNGHVEVARGDTLLHAGDMLTIVSTGIEQTELTHLLRASHDLN
jgi:CIC family chloride channel protein